MAKTHKTPGATPSSPQGQCTMAEIMQEQTASQLALLQCLVESVSRSTDFLSALNMVLKSICEATGLIYGEAWVPSADGTHVTISPACYIGDNRLWPFRTVSEGYTFEKGIGLPGRILASQTPLWIDDVSKDPSYLRASPAKGMGLGAGFGIPVITRRGLAAILIFYETKSRPEDNKQLGQVGQLGGGPAGLASPVQTDGR